MNGMVEKAIVVADAVRIEREWNPGITQASSSHLSEEDNIE